MTTASLSDIKKELRTLDRETLEGLCNRLAKYKLENKELLIYLLFEAHDERAYVENVKEIVRGYFGTLPSTNVYLMKKALQKILRFLNKQIKFSGIKQTELELRIFYCTKMKEARVPRIPGTVLFNHYEQQLKKIESALNKLPEDLQADYERELRQILL